MKQLLLFYFSLSLFPIFAQDDNWKLSVEQVQNNRKFNNSRVSDNANVFTEQEIFEIDSILKKLEDSTDFEIAVVCLESVGNQDARIFYTDLFNYWGIGQSKNDNGLLISLTTDIQQVDFITGIGTEAILTDAVCKEIQETDMIPYFKIGEYSQGIINGLNTTVEILYNGNADLIFTDPDEGSGVNSITNGNGNINQEELNFYDKSVNKLTAVFGNKAFSIYFLLTSLAGSTLAVFFLLYLVFIISKKDLSPNQKYKKLILWDLWIWFILFPFPMIFLFIMIKALKSSWKKQQLIWEEAPKVSPTGMIMKKLTFDEQDIVLSKGLIKPEFVKSELYAVYGTDDLTEAKVYDMDVVWGFYANEKTKNHGSLYNKYQQCPECHYKLLKFDKTRESYEGEKIMVYQCENCSFVKEENFYSSTTSTVQSTSTQSVKKTVEPEENKKESDNNNNSGTSWGGGTSQSGGASSNW
ncbi:TPM domain-containing protein [Paracrocinitomix mangrovi]|uniref:TPM domain-containing protein n=1 Tax=Paracrocinitomix mangrovi TaxID=2862509 RepID=UPI001C8E6602|nr:TPM domain-containing protein [Paracrocinitomix mangrovi]UKN01123.1 TPM domain-containing protein [Paracrocinitomix mangrovi]